MSRRSWVQSPVWSLFCTLTSVSTSGSSEMLGLRSGDVVYKSGGGLGSLSDWGMVVDWCGHFENGG